MRTPFRDRSEAGQQLARQLARYANRGDTLVLALPRGGLPVAYEVARALGAELDVFVVRKLGAPMQPELAMGAIASGGVRVMNDEIVAALGLSESDVAATVNAEVQELERRERQYRDNRPFPQVRGRTVILVDDGLATGASMHAAARALRAQQPRELIIAVPVGAPDSCSSLGAIADDVICLEKPEPFVAVGYWYESFEQTSDEEVREILEQAHRERAAGHAGQSGGNSQQRRAGFEETNVEIPIGDVTLEGTLTIPAPAPQRAGSRGVVLFAHGSGSSRHSPRNRFVARTLAEAGVATLLMDLLTHREEEVDNRTRALRFDIGLLANRLIGAMEWLKQDRRTKSMKVGLFGASTGGGAALVAAAEQPNAVAAVVSRGGRPDLAGDALPLVRASTLLIVGGDDEQVIELNEWAMARMRAPVKLEIVEGATHLFEEPGALEEVARLSRDWFVRHLSRDGTTSAGLEGFSRGTDTEYRL